MAYKRKPYESAHPHGHGHDRFVALYESMYTSPAWKELKSRQKVLYLYCRLQPWATETPGKDYPLYEAYQQPEVFYLNFAKVCAAGMYTKYSNKAFYDDIKALCNVGLIECLFNGRTYRKKSVYRLSALWQKYKPESET